MKTRAIPVICVLSIVAIALAANAPKPVAGGGAGFSKLKDLQGEPKQGWPITDLVFSADGKTLAGANHFKVCLWQVDSGKRLAAFLGKNDEQIMAVRFLAGGKHLVSASNRTVRVWDWAKGAEIRKLPGCHTVELSRDCKRLLAAMENGCGLWRTDNWKLVRAFKLPAHRALALSPDGTMIAVGERMLPKIYPRNYRAAVTVLAAETGKELARFAGFADRVVFSPEGKRLAVVHGGVALWSLAGKKLLRTFKAGRLGCGSAAFSPDGRLIAAGGGYDPATEASRGALAVWNVATGRLLGTLAVREGKKGCEWVTGIAFSADGKYLAACDSQGAVRIWQVPAAAVPANGAVAVGAKKAAAKGIRGFKKIDAFVRGDARIAPGLTRAEIRKQLSKGKVKSHKPYAFIKPQPEMFKRDVWVISYGPEVPGMGRVDVLRVSFKGGKASKLEHKVYLCP